jgi:hypothetical protein
MHPPSAAKRKTHEPTHPSLRARSPAGRAARATYAEAKQVIGGYWFILAGSLDEAAALAAQNPCLACGLSCEVRPVETAPASASAVSNENVLADGTPLLRPR